MNQGEIVVRWYYTNFKSSLILFFMNKPGFILKNKICFLMFTFIFQNTFWKNIMF